MDPTKIQSIMILKRPVLTFVLLIIILTACGGKAGPTATPFPFTPNSPEARGLALFQGKGRCASCHSLSPDTVIVGPSLSGVAARAAQREPPLTAADYLEESITQPDKFKAPGFEKTQMDTTLAKTLSTDEISDLVAFLLVLK